MKGIIMNSLQHFGIIGGGAWGTALGQALVVAGRDITLWAREDVVVNEINALHENTIYLPKVSLDARLKATSDIKNIAECDALVLVAPTQHMRAVCKQLAAVQNTKTKPVIVCAKGVEQNSLYLPGEIIAEEMPSNPVIILSGPTFAAEVAKNQPTAFTLACADAELGNALTHAIGSRAFRPYLSDDVVGAQVGGAVKNVMAVATGICTGCGMGDNARAALITRGLAEIMRLGTAMGARLETLMGLSGLGDLVLTCSSMQSRNMSLGVALGQGAKLADILASRTSVAEGVYTAAAALALAQKHNVDMPITEAVDAVLNKGAAVDATISALLARPLRAERA